MPLRLAALAYAAQDIPTLFTERKLHQLVLGGEGVVYVTNPSHQSLTLAGAVDGTQGLTKHGMGNLSLNSSANTFT
ncbi:MAG: hypothetical protein ABFD89_13710, partial [Bryobacteraceae bacterium]